MKDTVFNFDGKPDSVHYHGDLMIQHTYRAKNAMGGVTTKTDWFKIDSAMKKVSGDWDAPKSVY